MTSFNYGGKKARDEGLTYRCHQSNVIPDSIFFDSLGWGMVRGFFIYLFLRGGNRCLPLHRRDGFSLITITPMDMGKH